jgi:hypothetical protein
MERGGEQASSGRLVLRFVVGTTEVAWDRLVAALRVFEQGRASSGEILSRPPLAPRHVLLGALCAAPAGLQSALARARPLAERTGRVAGRGLRALTRLPGGSRLQAASSAALARTLTQIARWAEAGLQEEMASRSLARSALPELFELAMARLADSPDLQGLLQEQTQGLTAAAMNRLREYSQGADQAAQGLVSRLLHRGPGPAPHRPALARP